MSDDSNVVAVIDDDPLNRHALEALLSLFGHTVELYESGEALLERAAACRAFCLLIDVQLGSASGFDLARQLAEAGYNFPIIFLTEDGDQEVMRRAIEAGGVGCFQKPAVAQLLRDLLVRSKRGPQR